MLYRSLLLAIATIALTPGMAFADEGYLGVVFARHSADLATKVPATIREVKVRLGDSVRSGQVLIRLESKEIDHEIAQARAGIWSSRADSARASAEFAQAAAMLERREKVHEVFTREEIESLVARKATAEATLEAARAGVAESFTMLQALEERLRSLTICAPFAGQVASCTVNPGEYASAGETLVRVASTDELWVRFAVPAGQRHWLSAGRAVVVEADSTTAPIHAEVRQVAPEIDSVSGMIFAEAALTGASTRGLLPIGAVVRILPEMR